MINSQEWLDKKYSNKSDVKKIKLDEQEKINGELAIDNFPNLERIFIGKGNLTKFKINNCPNLVKLNYGGDQLTHLEIIDCPNLEFDYYDVRSINLTNLGLSNLGKVTELWCENNKLTELEINNCHLLEEIICGKNKLVRLNVSYCPKLEKLFCSENQLTNLDLEDCPNLNIFRCNNNRLSELNFGVLENLTELDCEKNQLTYLNLKDYPNLEEISCNNNKLSELDVSDCPLMKKINCSNNCLIKLNLGKKDELIDLHCESNKLTNLDISSCLNLEEFYLHNNLLNDLNLSEVKNLKKLNVSNNKFQSKNLEFLSHLIDLDELRLEGNQGLVGSLKSLRYMSKLINLNVSNTEISSEWEYLPDCLESFYCRGGSGSSGSGRIGYNLYSSYYSNNDYNYSSHLRNWKKNNPDKMKIVELTKLLETKEKQVDELQSKLEVENDLNKNLDKWYQDRLREGKEVIETLEKKVLVLEEKLGRLSFQQDKEQSSQVEVMSK